MVFSVVCANDGSVLSVPLIGVVFRVLRALTAVVNSVECAGANVGRVTVRLCNGADTVGCAVVAEVLNPNAGALVTGGVSALKGSRLSVDSPVGFVVLVVIVES